MFFVVINGGVFFTTVAMMYYKEKSNIQVEDDLLYGRPREENVGSSFSGCEYDNTWVGIFYSMFLPHENKLTKKIFGTKKALMREKIRQLAIKRWVIHPCSNFRWVSRVQEFLKKSNTLKFVDENSTKKSTLLLMKKNFWKKKFFIWNFLRKINNFWNLKWFFLLP